MVFYNKILLKVGHMLSVYDKTKQNKKGHKKSLEVMNRLITLIMVTLEIYIYIYLTYIDNIYL